MIANGSSGARDLEAVLRGILARYVGPIHAGIALASAARQLGRSASDLTERDREVVAAALARPLRLYLDEGQVRSVQREVSSARVAASERPHAALEAAIRTEDDVIRVRTGARTLAAQVGFDGVDAIKVATVVSELARNILQYAGSGVVAVRPLAGPPGVEIEATDSGPGIANLDVILGGRYASRTGLGLGLTGSKRLLDSLGVKTGPTGTRVVGRKRVA